MREKGLADVVNGLVMKRLYVDAGGAPVLVSGFVGCSLVPLTGDFSGKLLWGRKLVWTVSSRAGGLTVEGSQILLLRQSCYFIDTLYSRQDKIVARSQIPIRQIKLLTIRNINKCEYCETSLLVYYYYKTCLVL